MDHRPEERNVFRGTIVGTFLSLPIWAMMIFGGYVLMH